MAAGGRWCLAPFPPNLLGLRMCSDLGTQWNWHYGRSTPRLQEAFQFLFLLLWEPWPATCDQNQGDLPGSEKLFDSHPNCRPTARIVSKAIYEYQALPTSASWLQTCKQTTGAPVGSAQTRREAQHDCKLNKMVVVSRHSVSGCLLSLTQQEITSTWGLRMNL